MCDRFLLLELPRWFKVMVLMFEVAQIPANTDALVCQIFKVPGSFMTTRKITIFREYLSLMMYKVHTKQDQYQN